jgi:hypothetical protein
MKRGGRWENDHECWVIGNLEGNDSDLSWFSSGRTEQEIKNVHTWITDRPAGIRTTTKNHYTDLFHLAWLCGVTLPRRFSAPCSKHLLYTSTVSRTVFNAQGDSKLLSGFPCFINETLDNNLESPCISQQVRPSNSAYHLCSSQEELVTRKRRELKHIFVN